MILKHCTDLAQVYINPNKKNKPENPEVFLISELHIEGRLKSKNISKLIQAIKINSGEM